MNSNDTKRFGRSAVKRLPILVGAAVLSGGVFLTAQGLAGDGSLPARNAPIIVNPAAHEARSTPSGSHADATCRDHDGGFDDNGNDACKRLVTVLPTPNVLAGDDHRGRHHHSADHASGPSHHRAGPGTGDSGHRGTDDSGHHSGTESGHSGSDDSGHDGSGHH